MRDNLILSIDPGLGSTGYGVWFNGRLTRAGLLHAPKKGTVPERAVALAHDLRRIPVEGYARIVCEMPEFQGSAQRQMGWKTGDLQSLTFLVGAMAGVLMATNTGDAFEIVKPSEWKGQLPKPIVIDRIKARLGHKICTALHIEKDAWDAVGIGLWAQGRF